MTNDIKNSLIKQFAGTKISFLYIIRKIREKLGNSNNIDFVSLLANNSFMNQIYKINIDKNCENEVNKITEIIDNIKITFDLIKLVDNLSTFNMLNQLIGKTPLFYLNYNKNSNKLQNIINFNKEKFEEEKLTLLKLAVKYKANPNFISEIINMYPNQLTENIL